MNIYLNIKTILDKKKILQKDLANTLGVNKNTVINWFKNEKGIRAEQVPDIAKILRVTVASLYGEEGVRQEETTSEERINFQVDFMQKELDKKDARIETLIRENEKLKNAVPSKVKSGKVDKE